MDNETKGLYIKGIVVFSVMLFATWLLGELDDVFPGRQEFLAIFDTPSPPRRPTPPQVSPPVPTPRPQPRSAPTPIVVRTPSSDGIVRTVFLNRHGGTLHAGFRNDPARNVSTLIKSWGVGSSYYLRPYSGSNQEWREVVNCVRRMYSLYNVTITDQRPQYGRYIMVMVGDSSLRVSRNTSRVRPNNNGQCPTTRNGRPIGETIAIVFDNLGEVCGTVAHEVGHAYGLDHVRDCNDPMSYCSYGDNQTFQNQDIVCGETPRSPIELCWERYLHQNSHQKLLSVLGPNPYYR